MFENDDTIFQDTKITDLENGLQHKEMEPSGEKTESRKRGRKPKRPCTNYEEIALYQAGLSLSEISRITGIPEDLLGFDRPKRSRRSSAMATSDPESNHIIYPLEVRLFAIERICNGVSQVQVAKDLDCPISTVAGWWCKKDQIRSALETNSDKEIQEATLMVNIISIKIH